MCWTEADRSVVATPGARLEAKLIDGDATGKVRAGFACAAAGDKEKGYTVTYTIENRDARELSFRWAGLEGTVKAGGTFTKTVATDRLTAERSENAIIDFTGGEATVYLKTNIWASR